MLAKSHPDCSMNKIIIYFLFTCSTIISFWGCLETNETFSKLPPGTWRGTLKLDPEIDFITDARKETGVRDQIQFEEFTEGDLPFNFEVKYTSADQFYIEIINGEEKIKLDDISYNRDPATNKDTLVINFPPYDSYFNVIFEDNILEGHYYIPNRGNYRIHFVARHGQNHRFTHLRKTPATDLTGRWEVTFGLSDTVPEPAIGIFDQEGNRLTGTFMTETGDYRYLEGTIQANKMYLSCFDGAHMFLFEALINPNGTLSGIFRNGTHFITDWIARRNEDFHLTDPDSLTYLVDGDIDFSFPDDEGKIVSLTDDQFSGKPKIIQLMGTWCPNCVDETKFITQYLNEKKPELEVIAIAFERHPNPMDATAAIRRFRKKMEVPYPILYAGINEKKLASKKFPMLNQIISYPTLIFLDRDNNVLRIHTGFSGPATPDYKDFVEDFQRTVQKLVS